MLVRLFKIGDSRTDSTLSSLYLCAISGRTFDLLYSPLANL